MTNDLSEPGLPSASCFVAREFVPVFPPMGEFAGAILAFGREACFAFCFRCLHLTERGFSYGRI